MNKLAEQFAQALANGELAPDDVGYVLEHVDGFFTDHYPSVAKWLNTSFTEEAKCIYIAQNLSKEE